ncbi:hypothetical protein HETIRDRAFT_153262 [Heterobasidion irregulare TC 32-1]|uniref:Uncharacterized protein n=1 Tax=Heterobasidion irregulare (strain TC 32-1) TaxID=747525 RepID=W4JP24_HETIT|nr:uncharacterized protein HETIRDRAFT_153262 [Heterobasidion irregulare TC 32-1]ETW74641.1 hypothetical protein HETIRDRAFT_153262 [Heterobasidion irregulare TC 32-1]
MSPSLVGFQIDPFQDLLIAVFMNTCPGDPGHSSCQVRPLSMTGGKHSSGASESSCTLLGDYEEESIIHINGDLVTILVQGLSVHQVIIVWDWKAAKLKTQLHFTQVLIFDLAFLSDYLLCVLEDRFISGTTKQAALLVYDVKSTTAEIVLHDSNFVAAFLLPDCSDDVDIEHISLQVDLVPQSSSGGLAAISLFGRYTGNGDGPAFRTLDIFVHSSFLVRCSEASYDRRRIIPWSEWGPFNTHAVSTTSSDYIEEQPISLSGLRASARSTSESIVRVYDFDPLRIGRSRGEEEIMISDSCHVPPGTWNKDGISTHLPCLVSEVELPTTLRWWNPKYGMICELGLFSAIDDPSADVGFGWFGI